MVKEKCDNLIVQDLWIYILVAMAGLLVRTLLHGPTGMFASYTVNFLCGLLTKIFSNFIPLAFAGGFMVSAFLFGRWGCLMVMMILVVAGFSIGYLF